MTRCEAKQLETDAVIFPVDNERDIQAAPLTKEAKDVSNDEQSVKSKMENRFARLKKSLRKKSASIL